MTKLLGGPLYEQFYIGMQGATIAARWQKMAFGSKFKLDASKVKTGCSSGFYGIVKSIPRTEYFDKMSIDYAGLLFNPDLDTSVNSYASGYGANSPIAKYVYFYLARNKATSTGGVGETKQQVHNAYMTNDHHKVCKAWNDMCNEVVSFYYFLDMNITDYPEFDLEVNSRFNPQLINVFNFV